MVQTLRDEIRQRKPFTSPQEEALLSIVRTASVISSQFEQLLKPYGISSTQYNVLRILRGAEPEGLCRNELRDRMLTKMPDVTRLLDRMEEAGFVARARGTDDRRLVSTRITAKGRRLVDDLDAIVQSEHKRLCRQLSAQHVRTLTDLLTAVRGNS
jgi:DNA-binding MarR family transcriptional regulator